MPVTIRKIQPEDNIQLAHIIREILVEFDVPKIGTVYSDPDTDRLYQLFSNAPASCYFVIDDDGVLIGGCGVYPTPKLPAGHAELVKLYLTKATRGKGFGKMLMDKCCDEAVKLGYTHLYLESFPQLAKAISMYKKAGFEQLDHALGNSGHYACNIWMLKEL